MKSRSSIVVDQSSPKYFIIFGIDVLFVAHSASILIWFIILSVGKVVTQLTTLQNIYWTRSTTHCALTEILLWIIILFNLQISELVGIRVYTSRKRRLSCLLNYTNFLKKWKIPLLWLQNFNQYFLLYLCYCKFTELLNIGVYICWKSVKSWLSTHFPQIYVIFFNDIKMPILWL